MDQAAQVHFITAESSRVEDILSRLLEALAPRPPQLEVRKFPDVASHVAFLKDHANPHLVIVDGFVEETALKGLVRGLLEADPATSILVLMDHFPNAAETMRWLDRGVMGLLSRDFQSRQISEPLKEVVAKRLQSQIQRFSRVPVRHKIQVRLSSLEQAMVAETLNIGTGGMFIRMTPPDVQVGDYLEFEFLITEGAQISLNHESSHTVDPMVAKMEAEEKALPQGHSLLAGTGAVVWLRPRPDRDLPEGMGIQFSELTSQATTWLKNFVASHRIRSFIPQS